LQHKVGIKRIFRSQASNLWCIRFFPPVTKPGIEWRKVSGMRDRLIHDCLGVDYTIVWDVATNKLHDLRIKMQSLLQEIS
jgi:uncharacterized protein with HEPN domain